MAVGGQQAVVKIQLARISERYLSLLIGSPFCRLLLTPVRIYRRLVLIISRLHRCIFFFSSTWVELTKRMEIGSVFIHMRSVSVRFMSRIATVYEVPSRRTCRVLYSNGRLDHSLKIDIALANHERAFLDMIIAVSSSYPILHTSASLIQKFSNNIAGTDTPRDLEESPITLSASMHLRSVQEQLSPPLQAPRVRLRTSSRCPEIEFDPREFRIPELRRIH